MNERRPTDGQSEEARVFSEDVLLQARRIELRTRGLVESLFSGEYRSVFKGRGLEFADVREYQPGDDVRAIDWNVTARRGRPYLKETMEERELTALLMVDLSASKAFGTTDRSNARLAAEIASILALSAARNSDRVGLLLVTDRVELFVPPNTGRRHGMRLVLEMLAFRPSGRGTVLSAAFEYATKVLRQRSTVFLISDFLIDESVDHSLVGAARRFSYLHDLVPIRLADPGLCALPDVGLLAIVDPETGRRRLVDTSRISSRDGYAGGVATQAERWTDVFRELALDVVDVRTDEDYVPALIRFFRRRDRLSR